MLNLIFRLIKKISPIKRKEIKKIKVILNPFAGEGKIKNSVKEIRNSFKKISPDIKVDFFCSRSAGDLKICAEESVKEGYDILVVAGGDGAINETIQGIAGKDIPLGIIPLGTANVFAQEMGIPKDIFSACKIISEGKIRRVDLGKTGNGRFFLWMSGIGIDALVAKEVHGEAKENLGIFAYFIFALKQLKKIPYSSITIYIDGKKEYFPRVLAVVVGNSVTYEGKNFSVKSKEGLSDGYFDVIVVEKPTFLFILRGIFWFALGRKTYYRDLKYLPVKYYQAKKVKVESNPPVFVHTDGELIGETPQEFEISPLSLSLILPE
jgi:YegS/Rv2252/BmrU family lipid kinase